MLVVAEQEQGQKIDFASMMYQMMPFMFAIGMLIVAGKLVKTIYNVMEQDTRDEGPPKVKVKNVWEAIREILNSDGYVYIAVSQGCNYCPIAWAMIETAGIPVSKIVDLADMRNEDDVRAFINLTGIEGAPALIYVEDGQIVRKIEFTGDVFKDKELIKAEKEWL